MVCPICEEDNALHFKFSKQVGKGPLQTISVYRCSKCNFAFVHPMPDYEDRKAHYDLIGSKLYVRAFRLDGEFSQSFKEACRNRLQWIVNLRSSGRLLEIGCSTGCFLQVARDEGFEVAGVELSAPSAAYAREVLGLAITTGTIFDTTYPTNHFDIVYSWHTLEHVWNPNEVLDEISRTLKPGGVVLLGVPNGTCLSARILGARYPIVHSDHLLYFSPQAMTKMLTKHHLTLKRLWTYGWDKLPLFRGLRLVERKHRRRDYQQLHEESVAFATNWTKAYMLPIRLPLAILNPMVERLRLGDNLVCIATK